MTEKTVGDAKKRRKTFVVTLGGSHLSFDEFLEALRKSQIQILADIRAVPESSKFPVFDRVRLAERLPTLGITYHHLKELSGESRKVRTRSPNTGLPKIWQAYADYMQGDEFERGLMRLQALVMIGPVALFSLEPDWKRCYRRFLGDALTLRGLRVVHLDGAGKLVDHALSPRCENQHGKAVYPGAGEQLSLF